MSFMYRNAMPLSCHVTLVLTLMDAGLAATVYMR